MKFVFFVFLVVLMGTHVAAQSQDFECITNSDSSLTIINYVGPGGTVAIPTNINGRTVSGIGEEAFAFNTNITELTIPGSITNIADYACLAATSLTDLSLGNGITAIGSSVFGQCVSLTNIAFPSSIENIGAGAFNYCLHLATVVFPSNLTTIGDGAFGQSGLVSVAIPDSVTNIGGGGVFGACASLTNVLIGNGLVAVGYDAFGGCTNLTSIVIPGNVKEIGGLAFYQCSSLVHVYISNGVENIDGQAFQECAALASLTTPASLTNIGFEAFENSGLTNLLVLGNATIGESAFSGIPLRSVSIAGGVIGNNSFENCDGLATVFLGDGVMSIGGDAFDGDPISSIVIPSSVSYVGGNAFEECPLTNVTISDGVGLIGGYTFLGTLLSSVTLPGSVSFADDQVFFGCPNLTSVIIAAGVSNLTYGMFGDCNQLSKVLFHGNPPVVTGSYPSDGPVFAYDTNVTVYYLPGTTGWGTNYQGAPTALWNPVIQTGDGGFGVRNGQFGFNITGTPGIPVAVMACTNLANPVWTPLQSLTLTNGIASFSDPTWTNAPARYYGLGFP